MWQSDIISVARVLSEHHPLSIAVESVNAELFGALALH
jgi:hypothetical protein